MVKALAAPHPPRGSRRGVRGLPWPDQPKASGVLRFLAGFSRRGRFEPRADLPRRSPCAKLVTLIKGKPERNFWSRVPAFPAAPNGRLKTYPEIRFRANPEKICVFIHEILDKSPLEGGPVAGATPLRSLPTDGLQPGRERSVQSRGMGIRNGGLRIRLSRACGRAICDGAQGFVGAAEATRGPESAHFWAGRRCTGYGAGL